MPVSSQGRQEPEQWMGQATFEERSEKAVAVSSAHLTPAIMPLRVRLRTLSFTGTKLRLINLPSFSTSARAAPRKPRPTGLFSTQLFPNDQPRACLLKAAGTKPCLEFLQSSTTQPPSTMQGTTVPSRKYVVVGADLNEASIVSIQSLGYKSP